MSLAMEFGLASRETSWVVVEKREVPVTEAAELRRVPISITSGWGGRVESPGAPLAAAPQPAAGMRRADDTLDAMALFSRASLVDTADTFVSERGLGLFGGGPVAQDGEDLLSSSGRWTRAFDFLVSLQRADGSWDLDEALADLFGHDLGDLVAAIAGSTGDPDEARRAWATVLALKFLEEQASANRGEWALLADKAVRWLATVSAVPPGGTSWSDLAAGMRVSDL
jgi:hypothetical protein